MRGETEGKTPFSWHGQTTTEGKFEGNLVRWWECNSWSTVLSYTHYTWSYYHHSHKTFNANL